MRPEQIIYGGLTEEQRIELCKELSKDKNVYIINRDKTAQAVPFEVMARTGDSDRPLAVVARLSPHQTTVNLDTEQGIRAAEIIKNYVPTVYEEAS